MLLIPPAKAMDIRGDYRRESERERERERERKPASSLGREDAVSAGCQIMSPPLNGAIMFQHFQIWSISHLALLMESLCTGRFSHS